MKKYINNAEYNLIFKYKSNGIDTDKLCAIFIHLRAAKNGERRYNTTGKLKHYSLLRTKTKISRHAIEKYVPHLIRLGLVTINKDGGVTIIGINRSFKLFKEPQSRLKLIPIAIHENYKDTAINVAFTRVLSNIKHQKKQIELKTKQTRLLNAYKLGLTTPEKAFLNATQIRQVEALLEKYETRSNFRSKFCKETVLSLHGFSKLKSLNEENNLHIGQYFKHKLIKADLIASELRTQTIIPPIPAWKYFQIKEGLQRQYGRGIYWCTKTACVKKYRASKIIYLSSQEKTAS